MKTSCMNSGVPIWPATNTIAGGLHINHGADSFTLLLQLTAYHKHAQRYPQRVFTPQRHHCMDKNYHDGHQNIATAACADMHRQKICTKPTIYTPRMGILHSTDNVEVRGNNSDRDDRKR